MSAAATSGSAFRNTPRHPQIGETLLIYVYTKHARFQWGVKPRRVGAAARVILKGALQLLSNRSK